MEVSVSKENLSHFLSIASTIVEKKTTMPILANVKLSAEDGILSVAATDLEITFMGSSDAQVKTNGGITVNGKMLYDIVKELPKETVNLRLREGQRLEIQCGQSKFTINGVSPEEFPALRGISLTAPTSIEAKKLSEMLEKTSFAVATDETRYVINGIFIESIEGPQGEENQRWLRFVATDGHRIAMIDRPSDGFSIEGGVILPRKGIHELRKVLEDNDGVAYVEINDGFFTVQSDKVILGVRLVDGQFPDYRQVLPREVKMVVEVAQRPFLSAVRRVSLVTTEQSCSVRLKISQENLSVTSFSKEYGDAFDSISIKHEGDEIGIGFNARYLIDILNAMSGSENVLIEFSGEEGPAIFLGAEDEYYRCLIMPMRFGE